MPIILWLLVFLIIAVLIFWLVQTITANLPVPSLARGVIIALVALLLLIYLLQHFGLLGMGKIF